jgi:hypothetical protein
VFIGHHAVGFDLLLHPGGPKVGLGLWNSGHRRAEDTAKDVA